MDLLVNRGDEEVIDRFGVKDGGFCQEDGNVCSQHVFPKDGGTQGDLQTYRPVRVEAEVHRRFLRITHSFGFKRSKLSSKKENSVLLRQFNISAFAKIQI